MIKILYINLLNFFEKFFQRYERGILCDVWSSKLSFPGNRGQNETYVYELYVSNVILKCLLTEIDRVQFIDHFYF